jgi:CRP-like cAMP-binding protein
MIAKISLTIGCDAVASDPLVMTLLGRISQGKHLITVQKGENLYIQGDRADSIYFVRTGKVKVAVLSSAGKEAVISMRVSGGICGEECLVAKLIRPSTVTALEDSTLLRIERSAMLKALGTQIELSMEFIELLLKRSHQLEEDICDQLFNNSEKRLARVLIKLAQLRQIGTLPEVAIPRMSHGVLAEMVGTTRPRVSKFMNKFKKLKLIDYGERFSHNGPQLLVRTALLEKTVLQHSADNDQERQQQISI